MRKMNSHLSKGRGVAVGKKVGLSGPLYWILSAASQVLSCWVLCPHLTQGVDLFSYSYHSSTRENLQTPKKGALEGGAEVED